jgi:hypothetical protein
VGRVLLSIVIVLVIVIYSGCDEGERTVLTSSEKELLDSLYSKRVPYVRKEADSICDATYQMMFDRAADSIKQVYIEEIREIIERG